MNGSSPMQVWAITWLSFLIKLSKVIKSQSKEVTSQAGPASFTGDYA